MSASEIEFSMTIAADIMRVWKQLTSEEGLRSFFSPEVHVEFRVGGPFEIIFDPSAPAGQRGAEGMTILSIDQPTHFGFTWNSPPSIPEIRGQKTAVYIDLAENGDGGTILDLLNAGYGRGPEWIKSRDYFLNAWGNIVLPRLKYSLEEGPVDWNSMPDLGKYHLHKA